MELARARVPVGRRARPPLWNPFLRLIVLVAGVGPYVAPVFRVCDRDFADWAIGMAAFMVA